MAQVADEAGVSRATVFTHFGTKDELVAATIESLLDVTTVNLRAALERPGAALDRLVATGAAYLFLLVDHPMVARYIALRPGRGTLTDADRLVDQRIEQLMQLFEDAIAQAVDNGEVLPVDPKVMARFFYGAWNGVAAMALDNAPVVVAREDLTQGVLQIVDILVRGARLEP